MKRSRNAILFATLLFAVGQAGLNSAIESDALPVRDPIYHEKIELLHAHPEFWCEQSDRTRWLAVGSSRTQMLFDAEKFEPGGAAFNFGCAGCGPVAQWLHLNRILAAGARAEVLLLEIHPAFLAELPEPFEMRWFRPDRLREGEPALLRALGLVAEHPATGACPWLRSTSLHRAALLGEYAPDLLLTREAYRRPRCDGHGFVESIDPAPALRAELLAAALKEYAPAFAGYRPGGPAALALQRMIELGRAGGMRPILFVAPESSEFRSAYGEAGNARFAEFSASFAAGVGVPIHDFREALPDCEFADGHHPTPRGAATFTALLQERLKGAP